MELFEKTEKNEKEAGDGPFKIIARSKGGK